MSHLQCAKIIPASKQEVFSYLTQPNNLGDLLHGIISVRWQNPGVELKAGSEFLFLMSRFGIEQPIRFVVERVVLGNSLTYRQVSGVYARFVHTIKFEERGPDETLVTDILDYEVPFGLFGRLADDFFIKNDLRKILLHRLDRAMVCFAQNEKSSIKENDNKDHLTA